MAFPALPAIGQVHTEGEIDYQYRTGGAWVRYDRYTEVGTPSIAAGVVTIDMRFGSHQIILDQDLITVNYLNVSPAHGIQGARIDLFNDGVGSHTVTDGIFGIKLNGAYNVNTTANELALSIAAETWDQSTFQAWAYPTVDNNGFGTAYYETNLVGDGIKTVWPIAHLLNADNPMIVIRSATVGNSFVKGEDFDTESGDVSIVDANNLSVTIAPAVPNGETWRLSVTALDRLIAS